MNINKPIMSFQDILNIYRNDSFSEKDKGSRFEYLMKNFLLTHPLYANSFEQVWLWNEFPYKDQFGGKDIGIDIVVKTNEGDFWAVQCKCYAENAYMTKPAVDSFLATSSRTFQINDDKMGFSNRLWIATTDKWNSEAENTLTNQNPPVNRIGLVDLENAPVDWKELYDGLYGAKAKTPKKKARSHQILAMNRTHEHFSSADRGKLIMACGTGKTYTSLKIAEKETNGQGLVLFLVPSIALLGQTLNEWAAEAEKPISAICICSDSEVTKKKDNDGFSVEDLAWPASTNVASIKRQFKYIQSTKTEGMTVVFSTYQSIDVISKAQAEINKAEKDSCIFDLIICDEAHRTTGVTLDCRILTNVRCLSEGVCADHS